MLGVFLGLVAMSLAFVWREKIKSYLDEILTNPGCYALTALFFLTSTGLVYAQAEAPVNEAPVWLLEFLTYISTIPKVGPVLVEVAKWLGVLASVFTALSLTLTVILKIPEITARWAGASEIADKIKALHDKIQPWLKYLSIFNVQKK